MISTGQLEFAIEHGTDVIWNNMHVTAVRRGPSGTVLIERFEDGSRKFVPISELSDVE